MLSPEKLLSLIWDFQVLMAASMLTVVFWVVMPWCFRESQTWGWRWCFSKSGNGQKDYRASQPNHEWQPFLSMFGTFSAKCWKSVMPALLLVIAYGRTDRILSVSVRFLPNNLWTYWYISMKHCINTTPLEAITHSNSVVIEKTSSLQVCTWKFCACISCQAERQSFHNFLDFNSILNDLLSVNNQTARVKGTPADS
jgi:hypothetical protein